MSQALPLMGSDFVQLDGLYPLPGEQLPRQWRVSPDRLHLPEDWVCHECNGWYLAAHPVVHVSDLYSRLGQHLGWGVEMNVQLASQEGTATAWMPGGKVILQVEDDPTPSEIERALYTRAKDGGPGETDDNGVEGPWAAFIFSGRGEQAWQRVYVGATHSLVYSPDRRTVATSHNLIPGLSRDLDLSRTYDPLACRGFYAFGLTAFHGLHRLLPNHYLDLETFESVRHWPLGPIQSMEGAEAAARIVDHGRRLIEGLATRFKRYVISLSAGNDSRAVLAMTRPFIESGQIDVLLRTSFSKNLPDRIDLKAAKKLSRITGLPIETIQRKPQPHHAPDVQRMFVRVGEAYAGPIFSARKLHNPAGVPKEEVERFHLPGMGGETGRAFYWKKNPAEFVTAEALAARVNAPQHDQILSAAQRWLDGLPSWLHTRETSILDLAYVEQRLGCWQSPGTYLFPGPLHSINLMASARSIELMLRLPTAYRKEGALQRDMVAYGWQELLTVPFNEPFGFLAAEVAMRKWAERIRARTGLR